MSDLLEAVEAAQCNIERLADPGELRLAAERVMALARERGARSLLAASPVAERLVGALMTGTDNLVGVSAHAGEALTDVLIVDVNLASGTAVAEAARRARRDGACHVSAVVLHQLTPVAARASDCGVDALYVLDPLPPVRAGGTTDSGL